MSSPVSILVLGAGELGMSVLRGLAAHPILRQYHSKIFVLLRASTLSSTSQAKQRDLSEIRALGIAVIHADLGSVLESELVTIFESFDTVIGCLGYAAGASGVQTKIARAVLAAGVPRYIPWQFGVDYDAIGRGSAQGLFDEQLDVRDLLRRQSATRWAIVSTGMFMSFLFQPSFGVVDLEKGRVNALGSLETRVTVTAAEDIGRLTAEVIAQDAVQSGVIYTAGHTLSYGELADVVQSSTGMSVARGTWTIQYLKEEFEADPTDVLKQYRLVFGQGVGVAWDKSMSFNQKRGIETMDAMAWAQQHLKR